MSIRVFSTLTKTKTAFETTRPGEVGIYLCGPTVYKPSHIGHMVGPVIFDAIKRYLTYSGYRVTLVINITDVDDKLIAESQRRGITMAAVAEEMTADYLNNLRAMEIDSVDHFPKATDHIDEIIRITADLIAKGFAYAADGDVYFEVSKDAEYGKLSHRGRDAMQGEGGEMAGRKRAAGDFALWKSAKPGEPSWPSPWGAGRPGWHIECSAMSHKLLGETFDIHGGGLDLVFPHHENEIAQSECLHGKPQARYWLHNGLMQASNEIGKVGGRATREAGEQAPSDDASAQEAGKLGKSKGASPFRDLLRRFSGETIRFFLLSTHYRRPIDFGEDRISEIEKGLDSFYRLFARLRRVTGKDFYDRAAAATRAKGDFDAGDDPFLIQMGELRSRFLDAMDDDFNTGGAIGALFDLNRAINRQIDAENLEAAGAEPTRLAAVGRAADVLKELTAVLGLFRRPPPTPKGDDEGLTTRLIRLLIGYRADARKNKNFALADRVRKDLAEMGVVLEDRPTGTEFSIQK